MDLQEHSDQVLGKLTAIDRDLRSLRYTFGIVLIVLTVLLAIAAPAVVKVVEDSFSGPQMVDTSSVTPDGAAPADQGAPVAEPGVAAASTSTEAVATSTSQ